MEKTNYQSINRILYFSLLVFSISIIFVVSKYIGAVSLIGKLLKSLTPVFIAVFISFLVDPLIVLFLKKGIKRKYGVILVYGLLLVIIIGSIYFVVNSLIDQLNVFINVIPELLSIVTDFINKLGLSVNGNKITSSLNDILIDTSKDIMSYISSSFSTLFNILLGFSGAIFLSFDFPEFRSGIKKYIPSKIKGALIYYFKNFLPFIHKYFVGMLIDSILIFIISIIGFSIIGIDYNLVISFFIALTNLIPIIGPYIGGVPAVLIGFSVSSTLGISSLIVVVLVQLLESNFIQPLILRNAIKIHPLEGILGISLFGALFGVVGMILSPILVVAIKLLFLPYDEKLISEQT